MQNENTHRMGSVRCKAPCVQTPCTHTHFSVTSTHGKSPQTVKIGLYLHWTMNARMHNSCHVLMSFLKCVAKVFFSLVYVVSFGGPISGNSNTRNIFWVVHVLDAASNMATVMVMFNECAQLNQLWRSIWIATEMVLKFDCGNHHVSYRGKIHNYQT